MLMLNVGSLSLTLILIFFYEPFGSPAVCAESITQRHQDPTCRGCHPKYLKSQRWFIKRQQRNQYSQSLKNPASPFFQLGARHRDAEGRCFLLRLQALGARCLIDHLIINLHSSVTVPLPLLSLKITHQQTIAECGSNN